MKPRDIEDDFNRDVWCLLGLPFDAVSMELASEQIFRSSASKKKCVISTPNLNFVVTALTNSDFRDTVISSELSLLDGMPLLWVSKLVDTGVSEKVSGSDFFDYLWNKNTPNNGNLNVFFFGGEKGIAQAASENINARYSGVSCVGYLDPGFGPIDVLSSPDNINKINQSQADFLIVALGAIKGQHWIDLNRAKLSTPVISHLGAVINFVAGKVRRAPRWMQKSGLEWIWRIYQEPVLWRRYLVDGFVFSKLLLTRVVPYIIWRKLNSRRLVKSRPPSCQLEAGTRSTIIKIKGDCLHDNLGPIREVFASAARNSNQIELDLEYVSLIDGAFLGLCQVLLKQTKCSGGQLIISGLSPSLRRIFYWNCAEYLIQADFRGNA